jgi:hypothetical protein
MFASKHVRQIAIAMLVGAPVLVPAVAGANPDGALAARVEQTLDHAAGRGTIVLPRLDKEGLVVATVLGESGAHYGLDAVLTIWIPSEPVPELMFGGVYGRVFQATPQDEQMKARLEGTWSMVDESTGVIQAQVIQDGAEGAQVIGRIQAKFQVERQGEGAGVGNAGGHLAPLAGELGLDMLLAQ